jgi:hypothetical protein
MFYHNNYTIRFDNIFLASTLHIGVFPLAIKLGFNLVAFRNTKRQYTKPNMRLIKD